MTMRDRILLLAFVSVAIVFGRIGSITAEPYPARPITIVAPFPAGGPNDSVARVMAEAMRKSLGQPVIIENIAGASGSIGAGRVSRAAPDGYTLLCGGWVTMVLNGAAYKLPFDVAKDFEPVSLLTIEPLIIVGKSALPANNLEELIAWLKQNPDKAVQGTVGPGSSDHIAGLFFQQKTSTRFQFVPYRGSAPQMHDLIGGQIDFVVAPATTYLPPVRAGSVKAYAVTADSRLPEAPAIPTVDEAGLPGLYLSVWIGLWAPKGTPKSVIAKLNAAAVDALANTTVRARLAGGGRTIPSREQQSPEALAALQKADIDKWWPIVKAAGIRAE
jgi:tripartite-type tricarboxylate transporter receptor subunit TctC